MLARSLSARRLVAWGITLFGAFFFTLSPGCSNKDGDDAGSGNGNGDLDLGNDVMVVDLNDGDLLEDPQLVPCDSAADCCEADDGCSDESTYVCTTENYCGLIQGECESHDDCQGDTFCCEGELCRTDGLNDGVCISAAIPPGLDCGNELAVGEFAPDVQCEWLMPEAGDPAPDSFHVLATPLVIDLPYDSGAAAEIIIVTAEASSTPDASAPGVIRILNGQDCTLHDSIQLTGGLDISALATPAVGDVDADGTPEIIVRAERDGDAHHIAMLAWDGTTYSESWSDAAVVEVSSGNRSQHPWGAPALHDLNDDGQAEVLLEGEVWDNTGTKLYANVDGDFIRVWNGLVPVVADVDRDGTVELIAERNGEIFLSDWDDEAKAWQRSQRLGGHGQHFAVADFGTQNGDDFDPTVLDGIAEIVAVEPSTGNGIVSVRTITGMVILEAKTGGAAGDKGGPPVVGDLDADGFPEVGVAGATRLRVFDLDCPSGCNGEAEEWVRWSQPSQDSTSGQTGGTIFDFDGDGQAELVYADECFLRVYNGADGEVLFSSFRTSTTWLESPLVADVDNDENTELVVNSNDFDTECPAGGQSGVYVDAIHPGLKCTTNESCPSGTTCGADGLCQGCEKNVDCCEGKGLNDCGLTCADRLESSQSEPPLGMGGESSVEPVSGKVCRATHPGSRARLTGVRVLRDRLDRWASSRPMWNQHAYSITNIKTDGTIPMTSEWGPNWVEDDLNNFRANVQGVAGFEDLPDITGRLADGQTCLDLGSGLVLRATVCNRGRRAVGAELPATFYRGDPADGDAMCTSYTAGPVPTGGCLIVECEIAQAVADQDLTLVVNDDGTGLPKTVECRDGNNLDVINIDGCHTVR